MRPVRGSRAGDLQSGLQAVSFLMGLALVGLIAWALVDHWESFLAWKASAGQVPFFLGMALLPLVGIPTTPLFMLAGITFSLGTAILGSALAVALNLVLSHFLAKRWLRASLRRLLAQAKFPVPTGRPGDSLAVLVLVRLTPGLPTTLKNYAAALIEVPFRLYFIVSWTSTLLYAVGLIVLGDSLSNASIVEGIVAAALLGVLFAAAYRLRRYQRTGSTGPIPDSDVAGARDLAEPGSRD